MNLDLLKAISQKRYKIGGKLVLITDRKSHMSFRLVRKSMTVNGVIAIILRYFTESVYDVVAKTIIRPTSVSKSTFDSL